MIQLGIAYSYEDIVLRMKKLSEEYTECMVFRYIGQSHDGRPIPMIRLGFGESVLFCTAGVHGRESINPVLLLKMIEEYASCFSSRKRLEGKYTLYTLLKQYSICFVPLVNPDGYEIALHGFSKIRNPILRQEMRMKQINSIEWKYNARGVDINRNFPCDSYIRQNKWESPASENETISLIQLFHEYPSLGYLDFHSRGQVIYYYRKMMPFRYNLNCQCIARLLQYYSHYHLGTREEEMINDFSGGNSVQYYSEYIKKPAITIETVEDKASFPLDLSYQEETYREIHLLPLQMLKMGRTFT